MATSNSPTAAAAGSAPTEASVVSVTENKSNDDIQSNVAPVPSNPRKDTDSSLSTMTQTMEDNNVVGNTVSVGLISSSTLGNWSASLASPTVAAFSPSLDPKTSLHGWGLMQASKRAELLSRNGRQVAAVFVQLPNLYDTFAQSLNKAALVTLQPIIVDSLKQQQLAIHFLLLQDTVVAWSKEASKLAEKLRSSQLLGASLQAYLVLHAESVQGTAQRYQQAKQACPPARQRALAARSKFIRSPKQNQQEGNDTTTKITTAVPATTRTSGATTPPPTATNATSESASETPSKVEKARGVEKDQIEAQYKKLVLEENSLVKQCQRVEGMSLESLELLEDDCLQILRNSFKCSFEMQSEALRMIQIMVHTFKDGPDAKQKVAIEKRLQQLQEQNAKKSTSNFGKLLKTSFSLNMDDNDSLNHSSSGAMDADSLGLPEDIGKLRDSCRAQMINWANRLQAVRVLASFLENIASAAAKLGLALKQCMSPLITSENQGVKAFENFPVLFEGDQVLEAIQHEGDSMLTLASSLRGTRSEKLDTIVLSGDKTNKTASDTDEYLWKQLCEAARAQSRAEARYSQSIAQNAKIRERVKSVDSDSGSKYQQQQLLQQQQQQQPQVQQQVKSAADKVNRHMAKSFANFVSFLPDGGETAMKILAPGARATVEQQHLEEANSKEVKGRLVLDAAVEAASRALDAYKNNGESLVSKYEAENKKGWEELDSVISIFVSQIETMRSSRSEKLTMPTNIAEKESLSDEWLQDTRENMFIKVSESEEPISSSIAGFMLTVELSSSNESSLNGIAVDCDGASDEGSIEKEGDNDQRSTGASSQATPIRENAALVGQVIRKNLSFDAAKNIEKALGKNSEGRANDTETQVFINIFWSEPVDKDTVPRVVDSFSCSYGVAGRKLPRFYGRLFLSAFRLIYIASNGKKRSQRWAEILDIQPAKSSLHKRDDSISVTFRKDSNEEDRVFFSGLINRDQTMEVLSSLLEAGRIAATNAPKEIAVPESPRGAPVPPDETLKKMEVVISRHLKNISIKRFYEIVWSEGEGTDEKPLYKPWLEKACFDLEMGKWEKNEAVVGPWDGETYQQIRRIKFKVQRRTHLYIGPPIAIVNQSHRCRVEGDSKCVVAMTCQFDGLPYSDCFAVELRWIARRDGDNDILVEVGIAIDFRKSMLSMIKSKIKSGTIEETTPAQKNLFDTITAACVAAGGEGVEAEEEKVETAVAAVEVGNGDWISMAQDNMSTVIPGTLVVLVLFWRIFLQRSSVTELPGLTSDIENIANRMDQMESEIKAVKATLDEVLSLLKQQAKIQAQ